MIELIAVILGGVLWRLRGIMGWPFTLAFAVLQSALLWQSFGAWSMLFALWIMAGEPTGWKPKYIWDRTDWFWSAVTGLRIGLIGGIAVPACVWLHRAIGEPQIKFLMDEHWYKLPFWSDAKQILNWINMWHEFYFGAIFTAIVVLV